MAALDFPNAPTVGQIATLINGFSYQWDGAVWSLAASTGQQAGGDLTGTYPNPTVTPAAKSKWAVSGATLTPVDATKQVAIAPVNSLLWGSTQTVKNRLIAEAGAGSGRWSVNAASGSPDPLDDTSKPAWTMVLDSAGDAFNIFRSPPGVSAAWTTMLKLDATGNLTLPGPGDTRLVLGSATAKTNLQCVGGGNDQTALTYNLYWTGSAWTRYDTAKAAWNLYLGAGGGQAVFQYISAAGAASNTLVTDAGGNLTIAGATAVKASGTTWANPSDRRLKDSIEDYATGLAAILQLQPRTFLYNGKGGSTAGMRGYGFIADEVLPVMPETVSTRAGKLDAADEADTDIQTLDQSNLILALVNAVQELATRIAYLEAR